MLGYLADLQQRPLTVVPRQFARALLTPWLAVASALDARSFDRLTQAVEALLERPVAECEMRADTNPEDRLRAY